MTEWLELDASIEHCALHRGQGFRAFYHYHASRIRVRFLDTEAAAIEWAAEHRIPLRIGRWGRVRRLSVARGCICETIGCETRTVGLMTRV